MTTTIDNNQRKFLLAGKGWNTQTYVCNMQDIVKCAKEFEKNQPYTISHLWNGSFKKLSIKAVIELLEANQLDGSHFKKTKPVYALPSLLMALGIGLIVYGCTKIKKPTQPKTENRCPYEAGECPNVQAIAKEYQLELMADSTGIYQYGRHVATIHYSASIDSVLLLDNQ